MNILKALTNRLDELFPNIPIYVDESTQGIAERSFLIYKVINELDREPMERHIFDTTYNVVYLASKKDTLYEMEELENNLLRGLEHIYINDKPIRGKVSSEKIDRDLSVSARYKYMYRNVGTGSLEEKEEDLMRSIKYKGKVK